MAYDVARVRGSIPTLGDGWVYLDAAAGAQVPAKVSSRVASAFRSSPRGSTRPADRRRRTDVLAAARESIADLTGADPSGVVLGSDRAVLLHFLAEALSPRIGFGTGLVLSRLDEAADIVPWQRVAARVGGAIRWAEVDIETCDLPSWQFARLAGPMTQVVAVTAASPIVGTMPQLRQAAQAVHRSGGLLVVDAAAAAPYVALDIDAMDADVLALSADAWGGPQVGALVFRDPGLLNRLPSLALAPSAHGPARLELGELHFASLSGLSASVDFLAGLDDAAEGTRRERLVTSLDAMADYQSDVFGYLLDRLDGQPHVRVIGDPKQRIPVLAFTVDGYSADKVAASLADQHIAVTAVTSGSELLHALGAAEAGGVVSIGLGPYTTMHEIDRFVTALAALH